MSARRIEISLAHPEQDYHSHFMMARFSEDGEEELPDLTVIIRRHAERRAAKPEKTTIGTAMSTQNIAKSTNKLQHPDLELPEIGRGRESPGPLRSRPKKRVLKITYDNPLLHAFQTGDDKETSSRSKKTSKKKSEVVTAISATDEKSKTRSARYVLDTTSSKNIEFSSHDESTTLSNFILDNSSCSLSENSEIPYQSPPAKLHRRLVRGRRCISIDSQEESQPKPDVGRIFAGGERGLHASKCSGESQIQHVVEEKLSNGDDSAVGNLEKHKQRGTISQNWLSSSGCPSEGSFLLAGVADHSKSMEETSIGTPPHSPSKQQKRLLSPKKYPKIPQTPHRQNEDAFWTQELMSDEFSPKKPPESSSRAVEEDFEGILKYELPNGKLRPKQDPSKRKTDKLFTQGKHGIAEAFLRELDTIITDNKISEMAALTGGIKITWSKKLNTTAGRANWKRETMRSRKLDSDNRLTTEISYRHYASIELAEKIIDSEDRLLNVIAHEFCHLANFMVSGIKDNPHGKEFKEWAFICSQRFGDRGIKVTTKHSYTIDYKYIWECTACATEFKRHSKSINPQRHQCGSCKSQLVQTKPVPKENATVTGYHLFLKENMKKVKRDNPGSPQKEIMGIIGKMYQEHKASTQRDNKKPLEMVDSNKHKTVDHSEGSDSSSAIDIVARKLDFLDLASS